MFVEFEDMPEDSRIWIYQSDRELSDSEVENAVIQSREFLTKWTAHGADLKSSVKVYYHRFLVICLDENMAAASGCSIDSSVHFVQALGGSLNANFFNRTQIAFLSNGSVKTESLSNIKNGNTSLEINGTTETFNNLVQKKSDLENSWIVPIADSWLSKYVQTQKV